MSEKTPLPPISELFKESWNEFKKSFLSLLWLFLISVSSYIVIGIVLILIAFILGLGAFITNPELGIVNVLTNPIAITGFIVTTLVGVIGFILIATITQISTVKAIYQENKKESPIELIKSSMPFFIPVFATGIVSGLLVLGGFGLFIIPGLIFSFLFSFSTYEIICNKQTPLNALRRSYALFSTNFWGILGRMLIFFIISAILSMTISRNNQTGPLIAIVNTIVGWFGMCYSITLYKQINKHHKNLPGKSIKNIVIISVIGLILFTLFTSTILSQSVKLLDTWGSGNTRTNQESRFDMENRTQMPTEQELNDMLEQLPQNESMKFEDQTI